MSDKLDFDGLQKVNSFDKLVDYLRETLNWPIEEEGFEDITYDYDASELGLHQGVAAKIISIKRMIPLSVNQPWGILFVSFEPKRLPVVALRRILSSLALKRRESSNAASLTKWNADDLLFITNFGGVADRKLTLAQFSQAHDGRTVPELRVLGWDSDDTVLHLRHVAATMRESLIWPRDTQNVDAWREAWRSAFVLKNREVITTSKVLAERLAKLAISIRLHILSVLEIEDDNGPVRGLKLEFEKGLIENLDNVGFADTYAQMISYGLLSARISNRDSDSVGHLSDNLKSNPLVREILDKFLRPSDLVSEIEPRVSYRFDEFKILEVVELLDSSNIDAILRDFDNRNREEDPIIHFYELFLKEYDPERRAQRGVFYTPKPVVSHLVRSADELLTSEFGLTMGLADTSTWGEVMAKNAGMSLPAGISNSDQFVQILDPAAGTGTFLVEVIDLVYTRLNSAWTTEGLGTAAIAARWQEYVSIYLLPRLHGYEVLVAPYVIAHLKIGLKLHETGYRFGETQRALVFLTNALLPPVSSQDQLTGVAAALAHEAKSANMVKVKARFTVVMGNPPYSKLSANLQEDARAIVDRYRFVGDVKIRERGALQFEMNLQEDYVKFVRLAELLLSKTGVGIAALISNNGYLTTPTLRGMRDSLLDSFSSIWVRDLHGHIARGERGPHGEPEENVFDIIQGVALLLGSKTSVIARATLMHSDLYGSRSGKYSLLANSSVSSNDFVEAVPAGPYYKFIPQDRLLEAEWGGFHGLQSIFRLNSAGIITARDALVVSRSEADLSERIKRFAGSNKPDSQVYEEFSFKPNKRFDLRNAQAEISRVSTVEEKFRRILYRPFDYRWLFYHQSVVWSMARPVADNMVGDDGLALLATRQVTGSEYGHAFVSSSMVEIKSCSHDRNTQIFPVFIRPDRDMLYNDPTADRMHNFGDAFVRAIENLLPTGEANEHRYGFDNESALRAFGYVYSILHSPTYRVRYFEFLRSDFPRIPIPNTLAMYEALSDVGLKLANMHLLKTSVSSDSTYKGPDNPSVGRVVWENGRLHFDQAAGSKRSLGSAADSGVVENVSESVWNYKIGGYQTLHKWLKDRKGTTLSDGDLQLFLRIVDSVSETLSVMGEIDSRIEDFGGWPSAFVSNSS